MDPKAWLIEWCEEDRHWIVIAPIGVVVKRFTSKQQAVDWLDKNSVTQ